MSSSESGGEEPAATAPPAKKPSASRPARPQISYAELEEIRRGAERATQAGQTYNIWYNKMSGGDSEDGYLSKEHSKTRCNLARDAGYTRADLRAARNGGNRSSYRADTAFVCLFFARGCCPKG